MELSHDPPPGNRDETEAHLKSILAAATSLANELNQPLTAIANYCEGARMIADRLPQDESAAKLGAVLGSASGQVLRAGEIIRRLRDLIAQGGITEPPSDGAL